MRGVGGEDVPCHAYSSIYMSLPGRAHVAEQFLAICSTSNVVSVEQCREAERAHEIIKKKLRKEAAKSK